MLNEYAGRLTRTLVLLTTGRCESFDDEGRPATVTVRWKTRLKIVWVWWVW